MVSSFVVMSCKFWNVTNVTTRLCLIRQWNCGIVLLESKEKVLPIKKGDALALPFGAVTWWYNNNDETLVVLFLGDTSKGHKQGEFTNLYLTRSNGLFTRIRRPGLGPRRRRRQQVRQERNRQRHCQGEGRFQDAHAIHGGQEGNDTQL